MGLIKIILIIFPILFVVFGFIAIVYVPLSEENKMKDFCVKNDYEGYEKGNFAWEPDYCIRQEGNFVIKEEIQSCDRYDWCFVREVKP